MLKIGLTGGIGSGKTTVANIFKVLAIPVFNADDVAKRIMEEDEQLKASIKKEFGELSYVNDRLNRKYLADIVFKDAYKLDLLNSLTHPVTIATAQKWMAQQSAPYAIKEAALLFESAAAADVDYIIGVSAPPDVRMQRVTQRDGVTRQEVMDRMNRQIDEELKMKLCDFVIQNDEQQLLIPQVIKLHETLVAKNNLKENAGSGLLS